MTKPPKLEAHHIAGYLPYGVLVTKEEWDYYFKMTIDISDPYDMEIATVLRLQAKLILYPLYTLSNEQLHMFSVDFRRDFKNRKDFKIKNYLTLFEAEWLYKNHFDIHGLIDAKLAYNINLLEDNDAGRNNGKADQKKNYLG